MFKYRQRSQRFTLKKINVVNKMTINMKKTVRDKTNKYFDLQSV